MPRRANESLKRESGYYDSQYKASAKYDKEQVDNIRLRVPVGWKELMKDYVDNTYINEEDSELKTHKYKSVNEMLVDLIRKELKIDLESNE